MRLAHMYYGKNRSRWNHDREVVLRRRRVWRYLLAHRIITEVLGVRI